MVCSCLVFIVRYHHIPLGPSLYSFPHHYVYTYTQHAADDVTNSNRSTTGRMNGTKCQETVYNTKDILLAVRFSYICNCCYIIFSRQLHQATAYQQQQQLYVVKYISFPRSGRLNCDEIKRFLSALQQWPPSVFVD